MAGPEFFVPRAGQGGPELAYEDLAAFCRRAVPAPGRRVYSIDFRSNSETWTATVGKHLSGHRTDKRRRRGRTVDVKTQLSNATTVLAIFAGDPYMVVTEARPITDRPSSWAKPHPGR